jgi:hypothetical protein
MHSDGTRERRIVDTGRTVDEIVAIRSAKSEQERQLLLSQFIERRRTYFSQVAQRTRYRGIQATVSSSGEGEHYADILSIVTEVASSLALEGFDLNAGCRFESVLQVRARSAIRAYAESGAASGISKMAGHERRSRSVAIARSRLVQRLGREPTDDEVLAEQHRSVSARKDAVKQGMVASRDDLNNFRATPVDNVEAFQAMSEFQMGGISVENQSFIASLIADCSAADPTLGEFAKTWIDATMAGEALNAVSQRLGISDYEARKCINEVRRRAIRQLEH